MGICTSRIRLTVLPVRGGVISAFLGTGVSGSVSTPMTTGTYAFAGITSDSTTNIASGAFLLNRWGMQVTSSTGVNAGATGAGLYTGLTSTPETVATGLAANNVTTLTNRGNINYLQAAGTYKSTFTWRVSGGA